MPFHHHFIQYFAHKQLATLHEQPPEEAALHKKTQVSHFSKQIYVHQAKKYSLKRKKKNNQHLTDSFHNSYRKEVARNQRLFLFSVCGITIVLPAQAQLKIVTSRACQSFLLPRTASAEGETSRTDRQTPPHPRTDRPPRTEHTPFQPPAATAKGSSF